MKGVKRTISSQHSTKLGKKHKISMCECSVISPSNCDVCAKIARKIHRWGCCTHFLQLSNYKQLQYIYLWIFM